MSNNVPRAAIYKGSGLPNRAAPGDGFLSPAISNQGDADATLTVAQLLSGFILGTITAARAYTMPTKALLDAALADMAIGETIKFLLFSSGHTTTLTGVTSVTVVGGAVATLTGKLFVMVKTSTGYICYGF